MAKQKHLSILVEETAVPLPAAETEIGLDLGLKEFIAANILKKGLVDLRIA